MFNASDRIGLFQNMILADNPEERFEALRHLLPLQQEDFKEILRVMQGFPVTIRLLDPPLHEFLPSEEAIEREIQTLEKCQEALGNVCQLPQLLRDIDPSLQTVLAEDEHMLSNLSELQSGELKKRVDIASENSHFKRSQPNVGSSRRQVGDYLP